MVTRLFIIAALSGREEVVRALVTEYKCPVDCVSSDGSTPLHLAARKGHSSVVRLLLAELGADASVTNNSGDTALHLAARNGQGDVVSLLITEFGCTPHIRASMVAHPFIWLVVVVI